MADLVVKDLERRFGDFVAAKDIDFTAHEGEFLTLLGPSGCGKSTTLWMIAGLDNPTRGSISLGSEIMADASKGLFTTAESRNFGLVFQSYALWPHMTVRQNLDFPLKLRKLKPKERQSRIEEALDLVELTDQVDKYPYQLSGGQQQRVALARTIVYRPRVLLLDEPLSNLDAKLRERARVWLRDLQRRLGVTTLYVTHDQSEALAMSDRIVIMRSGSIVQNGTPEDIYRRPADAFVADFIGSSNFLDARAGSDHAGIDLVIGGRINRHPPARMDGNTDIVAAFRPEDIRLLRERADGRPDEILIEARVVSVSYLGSRYQVVVEASGKTIRIEASFPPEGDRVFLAVPEDAWMVFPKIVDSSRIEEISSHAD